MKADDAHVRFAEHPAHELVWTKAGKSISIRQPTLPMLAHP